MTRTLLRPATGFALLCALLAGCGGPPLPPPVDTAEAGRHLDAVLKSWKDGEPYDGLAKRDPPVVFNEPLWRDGTKLLDYELGEVELHGRQGRAKPRLTLLDKDGKQTERRIGYQIDTTPRVVIVREALGP